jgi:DNA-directed RNA polymerase specialized sigma24 family protein
MVVLLVDVQGLDYHEVAEAMGIALGTVKSRLSRRAPKSGRRWPTMRRHGNCSSATSV